MADYRLYWYPGTCARVTYVALEEIGAPYEVTLVDLIGGPDPGYAEVNPKGKVPTLIAGGRAITENPAIQTYLSRRHPEAGLLPNGDAGRELEALELMSWFAAGVHPPITRQRFPRFFTSDPDAWPEIQARARAQLEDSFRLIERRLGAGEWLYEDWTVLDVYLLWLWFRATGSGMDGAAFPACAAHAARCEARPSVASVLDREEAQLAELRAAGRVPDHVPAFQAGRAPTF
jgi:glutathione S-transferase